MEVHTWSLKSCSCHEELEERQKLIRRNRQITWLHASKSGRTSKSGVHAVLWRLCFWCPIRTIGEQAPQQMTERTSTHAYPHEEIHAMMNFYGGKTCVLTHNRLTVHWAHMFDAALLTSNQRVRHTFHLQLSSLLTLKMQLISFNGC